MGLTAIGLLLNILVTFIVYGQSFDEPIYAVLFNILIISWLISIVGLILAGCQQTRIGAILIIIGSIVFIPLGLISLLGARNMMQPIEQSDLEARRAAIKNKNKGNISNDC